MKHESRPSHAEHLLALISACLILVATLAACGRLEVDVFVPEEPTRPSLVGVTPTPNFDEPPYATEAGILFDDRLELVGYTVEPRQEGPAIQVTLIWQVLDVIPANYHTFVHAFNAQDQLLAQTDGPTGGGWRNSKDWIIGEYVYDQQQLPLPTGVAFSDVEIRIGLYDADQGQRARTASPTSFTLRSVTTPDVTQPTVTPPAPRPTGTPWATDETELPLEAGAGQTMRVAYVKDGNVWMWDADGGSHMLTQESGVDTVWLSDDGRWTAFRREGQIWAIRNDGSDERQVTRAEDFQDEAGDVEAASEVGVLNPVNLAWRPGSHALYFNTSPYVADLGLLLSDDLWRYDAESGALEMVLAPGEGGNFLFAPDGEQMALIAPGRIELMNADGSARRVVFTYPPVTTGSEFAYYAQPVWSADSSALMVVIPPVDSAAVEAGPSTVWRIPVDDEPAQRLGEITTLPGLQTPPLIAPDLGWIGFLTSDRVPPYADSNYPSLAVTELGELVADTPFLLVPDAINLHGWSPDSARLLYQSPTAEVMEANVIESGAKELFAGGELGRVGGLQWVDKFRYFFIHYTGDGWELRLGVVDGRLPEVIAEGTTLPAAFDFAWGS